VIATEHPRPRANARCTRALPIAFLRRLDWVLLFAAGALVAYGLWLVAGITRFDVPGDERYFVFRQGIAAAVGVVGLVVADPRCRWISPGATGGFL